MITIQTTPLSYRIKALSTGQLCGTHIYLEEYLRKFNLTTWDQRARRFILMKRYVHFCRRTSMLYIPRYDLDSFLDFLRKRGVEWRIEEIPLQTGKTIDINLKPGVTDKNEKQTKGITQLLTSDEHLQGLSLNPGEGKTYCTIKVISVLKKRAFIACIGLVDQWIKSILQFTDLKKEDIYVIQGAPSVAKLLSQIDRNIHPKIIMCSLATLRGYVMDDESYGNYPPFDEICDRLGIGIRVIDEAHLNFHLSLLTDLRTNAYLNIALTATFDRNEIQVKTIFNNHYPPRIRYGEDEFTQHVDIFSYSYTLGNMLMPQKAYHTANGYNHSKMEDYLLRKMPTKLEYVYDRFYATAIYSHYVNIRKPGQKLLILCSTIEMCKWFKRRMEIDLPKEDNFKICIYVNGTSDDELEVNDIIVSTPGSAGTGTDIKDLLTVIMTVATGSDILNKQSLGRLREIFGVTPNYAYFWNRDIIPHCNYQETRRITFTQRGKNYKEYTLG